MNRKVPLLLLSHACVVAVVFGASRQQGMWGIASSSGKKGLDAPAKTGPRDLPPEQLRGQRLLKEFLGSRQKAEPDYDSKYRKLVEALPVAADPKAAAIEEIEKLNASQSVDPTEQQEWDELAMTEVRLLHWMRQDPLAAMKFISEDDLCHGPGIPYRLDRHVYKDLIKERGLAACLPWVVKTTTINRTLTDALAAEVKGGGGVATLESIHSKMMSTSEGVAYFDKLTDMARGWKDGATGPLRLAASSLPFSERDALLAMVNKQEKEAHQIDLLRGFARSSPEAASWLLDKIRQGELRGTLAERTRQDAIASVQQGTQADLGLRVDAMVSAPGRAAASRESLATELIEQDVSNLLKEGRDWRYEFRHGAVSGEEVLASMREGLPGAAQASDASLRKALFRSLVEENPEQARTLLAKLPAEESREVEYKVLQGGFAKSSPDIFSTYLAALPAAESAKEKDLRREALLAKSTAYAERFGDNYEQAVKSMPTGPDRNAAVEGVVQQSRKSNPQRASEVADRLSTQKP